MNQAHHPSVSSGASNTTTAQAGASAPAAPPWHRVLWEVIRDGHCPEGYPVVFRGDMIDPPEYGDPPPAAERDYYRAVDLIGLAGRCVAEVLRMNGFDNRDGMAIALDFVEASANESANGSQPRALDNSSIAALINGSCAVASRAV